MDKDFELSESSLQGVQRECSPDPGTANASSQQDEQLYAVVVSAELTAKRECAHHGNQSNCKFNQTLN